MTGRFVTPSLYLGRPNLPDTIDVQDAEQAVQVIRDGKIAVLPEDAIDQVELVLQALGADEDHIASRIQIAREGNLPLD